MKNMLALGIGCLLAFLVAEGILRLWSPLHNRVHGDRIRLIANSHRIIQLEQDKVHPGMDPVVEYSTNSIGFRGPEPDSSRQVPRIFAVGGSTTECRALSDGDTWPAKLQEQLMARGSEVWINNAGIDGTSTFGHQYLLEDHLLEMQPDMIVFLVGVNDLSQTELQSGDTFLQESHRHTMRKYMQYSEVFNLLITLYRANRAQHYGLHHPTAADTAALSADERNFYDSLHLEGNTAYEARLSALADTCLRHDILPVFVTQPIYKEDIHRRFIYMDGYNETLLNFCAERGLLCIDLDKELADSDAYYYDFIHYTRAGASEVARIIAGDLDSLLKAESMME